MSGMKCVKCLGTDIATRWQAQQDGCGFSHCSQHPSVPEQMVYTCRTCTYEWTRPPADANSEPRALAATDADRSET